MFRGFFTRSTPEPTPEPTPAEAPGFTIVDPTAWMTDEERAFHTFGGVTR